MIGSQAPGSFSMTGHELAGDKPMYYVYLDEAGISAKEPSAVVVGVLMRPDAQWRKVNKAIESCIDKYVPPSRRPNFIFHAKDVYQGGRQYDDWPFRERLCFLEAFVNIPRQVELPIAYGVCQHKDRVAYEWAKTVLTHPMTFEEYRHYQAFAQCLAASDAFLQRFAKEDEIATAIAEDSVGTRRLFRNAKEWINMDATGLFMDTRETFPTLDENPEPIAIKRIMDAPMFTPKDGSPMLQLADACAFTMRRFLAKQKHGYTLMRTMTLPVAADETYDSEICFGIFGETTDPHATYG